MSKFRVVKGQLRYLLRTAFGPAFFMEPDNLSREEQVRPNDIRDVGPGRIVVVIPAHNEAPVITGALKSLSAQTRLADEIVVVADRCMDNTSLVARIHGVATRLTILNRDNKAGALNQEIAELLPRLSDNDAVLMMDADSVLSPTFISEASWRLREPNGDRPMVGAVGGIFLGYPVHGFVVNIQDNEYLRYARDIQRRKGRADVLTGVATLFSARALRAVEHARSTGQLPPGTGIYDVNALTEDNEMTLALKHVGYRCVSPRACTVGTELMPTISRLFHQRLRWQRGALQNLLEYGVTRYTLPYIVRQLLMYSAVAFLPFFLTTMIYALMKSGSVPWAWFWIYVTAFVVFERVWSVRRGRWQSVLLAALVLPEAIYDLFLHTVYIESAIDVATHSRGTWEKPTPDGAIDQRLWRRHRRRRAALVYTAVFALVIGLALGCSAIGIAWLMIATFVLAGAVAAAIRLINLDPFGFLLGSGEPSRGHREVRVSSPQGFGGPDIPKDDTLAKLGGEGPHHWLSGGAGARNPRVTSSSAARLSRQRTVAWLEERRHIDTQLFEETWGSRSNLRREAG
jgi:cellulose synthase/poly-beta-1,6-N-acetylglucosamine synthase-like glycosyltransferase